MESAVKEYVRVMHSLNFDENEKERLLNNVITNSKMRREIVKKQIALASVVAIATAVCVSVVAKSGKK